IVHVVVGGEAVQVLPPGLAVAVYDVTTLPPSLTGASHETTAPVDVPTALTPAGGMGTAVADDVDHRGVAASVVARPFALVKPRWIEVGVEFPPVTLSHTLPADESDTSVFVSSTAPAVQRRRNSDVVPSLPTDVNHEATLATPLVVHGRFITSVSPLLAPQPAPAMSIDAAASTSCVK